MERVSVARMATAKLQGWIHAARGMRVSGSVTTELNSYKPQKKKNRISLYSRQENQRNAVYIAGKTSQSQG